MSGKFLVLVAEDEESDFELLEIAIQRGMPGCRVSWVRDGADAQRYIAGQNAYGDRRQFPFPDLVITDLKLPHVGGMQLIEWLKTGSAYRRLPIVVMSSSNQPVDIDRAYSLGTNAYFVKPTRFDDLVELCRLIMGFWARATRADGAGHHDGHEPAIVVTPNAIGQW